MHFGSEQSSRVTNFLFAGDHNKSSTGRRALRPLEDYAIMLFRRMASILAMQIGIQTNGTYGNYIISKQLHRNIWRAVYLDTLSGSLLLNCQNSARLSLP